MRQRERRALPIEDLSLAAAAFNPAHYQSKKWTEMRIGSLKKNAQFALVISAFLKLQMCACFVFACCVCFNGQGIDDFDFQPPPEQLAQPPRASLHARAAPSSREAPLLAGRGGKGYSITGDNPHHIDKVARATRLF